MGVGEEDVGDVEGTGMGLEFEFEVAFCDEAGEGDDEECEEDGLGDAGVGGGGHFVECVECVDGGFGGGVDDFEDFVANGGEHVSEEWIGACGCKDDGPFFVAKDINEEVHDDPCGDCDGRGVEAPCEGGCRFVDAVEGVAEDAA